MLRAVLLLTFLMGWSQVSHAQSIPVCNPDSPLAHGAPSTSSDERYTVYFDCYDPAATTYTVYVHDAQTDKTRTLGQTAPDLATETMFVARWLTDTQVAVRAETGGGTYNWRSVYISDAAEPNSLTEVARDYVASPRYADKPPRYEWAVEDGIEETFAVYRYSVESGETDTLYTGDCLLRDDNNDALSCHMVTPLTNQSYVEGEPTRLILNIGDSIREVKTIEVRALPEGDLLYTADTLGSGYAEWLAADTLAVFDLAFDMEAGGFAGEFVRLGAGGDVLEAEPFVLDIAATLVDGPSWLAADD